MIPERSDRGANRAGRLVLRRDEIGCDVSVSTPLSVQCNGKALARNGRKRVWKGCCSWEHIHVIFTVKGRDAGARRQSGCPLASGKRCMTRESTREEGSCNCAALRQAARYLTA